MFIPSFTELLSGGSGERTPRRTRRASSALGGTRFVARDAGVRAAVRARARVRARVRDRLPVAAVRGRAPGRARARERRALEAGLEPVDPPERLSATIRPNV